jgi:hypothetical protein
MILTSEIRPKDDYLLNHPALSSLERLRSGYGLHRPDAGHGGQDEVRIHAQPMQLSADRLRRKVLLKKICFFVIYLMCCSRIGRWRIKTLLDKERIRFVYFEKKPRHPVAIIFTEQTLKSCHSCSHRFSVGALFSSGTTRSLDLF